MDVSKSGAIEGILAAETVLPAPELQKTIDFFVGELGFRMTEIFPADDPQEALVVGHGLRLRLLRGGGGDPGILRLATSDTDGGEEMVAPNGTRIQLVPADPPMVVPPGQQTFSVQKMGTDAPWIVGRAGMQYRDLIPDRQGGRFIASHIRIPDGGPVPDNVHFHKIRFQMIYCYKGWVRLVYEDQGEPFILKPGDCILQPPQIRHRVLECSDGLEVIEIGCPAQHMTLLDHDMPLPTGKDLPDRDFGGQKFVWHKAAEADWSPWRLPGFEARDIGIAAATDGLAGVTVARKAGETPTAPFVHDGEFLFYFVLEGGLTLDAEGQGSHALAAGDCATVPAGVTHAFGEVLDDIELLEVSLPAL
jgi:quercetin dioxygenase-like cupin family protein